MKKNMLIFVFFAHKILYASNDVHENFGIKARGDTPFKARKNLYQEVSNKALLKECMQKKDKTESINLQIQKNIKSINFLKSWLKNIKFQDINVRFFIKKIILLAVENQDLEKEKKKYGATSKENFWCDAGVYKFPQGKLKGIVLLTNFKANDTDDELL